jgi:hypothetical protein
MSPEERMALIDQLDRSFVMMPRWSKNSCLHAMGAPKRNPASGEEWKSFREIIEHAADHTLEILRDDFEGNGELLPPVPRQ